MNEVEIDKLIQSLRDNTISMVFKEEFLTILKHKNNIDQLNGDIVECGCWRGGFSIFLSKLFPNKKIWAFDSFEGFQNPSIGKYSYANERHTPSFTHNMVGPIAIPYEETYNNFISYGLEQDLQDQRIKLIKGFVKETTNQDNCQIEKISILRIDVDAYSATLEILDNLYDKVVDGGYVIFDDSCLVETKDAMLFFLDSYRLSHNVYHPNCKDILDLDKIYTTDNSGLPCGCFIIKGNNI